MQQRDILLQAFREAIARCQPDNVLAQHLPPVPENGRLLVLAAGKGAGSMAAAAEKFYGKTAATDDLTGVVVVPHGVDVSLSRFTIMHAAHPVPDRCSEQAARTMLAATRDLTCDDHVVVLLSGGASALLCAPIDGLTLAQKRRLTQRLLSSGASISEINTIRSGLSDIKGGQLARACNPARVTTLAVSDVAGDYPEVIGSGPTVDVQVDTEHIISLLRQYDLRIPEALEKKLGARADNRNTIFPRSEYHVVIRPMDALQAAANVAARYGYEPVIVGDAIEGEARDVAADLAGLCRDPAYGSRKVALLSGGEVTVTNESASNGCYGGSNREFALALAKQLPPAPLVNALIADTDGADGQSGSKGPVAGAFVDNNTLRRGLDLGLDIDTHLTEHRSGAFFELLEDELLTGPTHTNVNDFRMLLIN